MVAKIAGDWKTLNEEQKQPYVDLSKEDKLRYLFPANLHRYQREKKVYDEVKAKKEEEEEKNNGCKGKRDKPKSKGAPNPLFE